MNDKPNKKQPDDEIDLREIFNTLWEGKWIITGTTAVFAVVAVIVALMLPNQYKATAVLAPAQNGGSSLTGALAAQFGGLASLAGINLDAGESNESQVAMEIMKSWGFVERFIKEKGIEVEVFAAKKWNAESNKLEIDRGLYDVEQKKWVRNPPSGKTINPTSWELYEVFSKKLSISQAKDTGLISVSIEYFSPALAKVWVDEFVKTINDYMRERKLEQVSNNIAYLEEQIEKTSIAEMKDIFYQIVEEQTKSKMLAEASPEYAFVEVSGALIPEEKSSPKRVAIIVLITFFGGVLSVIFVFIRNSFGLPGR